MLIYLDIDGVMVRANSWKRPEMLEDGFYAFSSRAVKALKKLIHFSNAEIVLTTSHKNRYSINEWHSIFNRRNIKVNKISRLPENISFFNRKEELLKWFNKDRLSENFIIIDDDKSLNGLPLVLKDKLIQTSASVGLTEILVDEAIKKIENNYEIV